MTLRHWIAALILAACAASVAVCFQLRGHETPIVVGASPPKNMARVNPTPALINNTNEKIDGDKSTLSAPIENEPPRSIGTAAIEGRIVDMYSGQPIPVFRAWVKGTASAERYRYSKDDGGRFTVRDLPAGTSAVTVRAPGHADAMLSFPALEARETRRNLLVRMEAGAELDGHVVDRSGRPIQGAEVRVEGDAWDMNSGWGDVTNDDGSFYLKDLPSTTVKLRVSERRFATKTISLNASRLRMNEVTITLDPAVGGIFEGFVTLDGKPLSGIEVQINSGHLPGKRLGPTIADANGYYRFDGVHEGGAHVYVTLRTPEGPRVTFGPSLQVVEAGSVREDIALVTGTATIEGTVYTSVDDILQKPISVIGRVSMHGEEQQMIAQTNTEGQYKFAAVPAGDVQLQVILEKQQRSRSITFSLAPGEHTKRDITFAGPSIRAAVSRNGTTVLKGLLWLVPGKVDVEAPSKEMLYHIHAQIAGIENGVAEYYDLKPGAYTVFATPEPIKARSKEEFSGKQIVEVSEDRCAEIRFDLPN